jgi:hypothetical protein
MNLPIVQLDYYIFVGVLNEQYAQLSSPIRNAVVKSRMAIRRKAAPVTLTAEQRTRLERLWFIYGNYGPKSTPGNHSFIQRLIENGIDERPLNHKRTPKSQLPTSECEACVDQILSEPGHVSESDARHVSRTLHIVTPAGKQQAPPSIDPELQTILRDMNLHQLGTRERLNSEDDAPDAA